MHKNGRWWLEGFGVLELIGIQIVDLQLLSTLLLCSLLGELLPKIAKSKCTLLSRVLVISRLRRQELVCLPWWGPVSIRAFPGPFCTPDRHCCYGLIPAFSCG